MIKAAQSGRKYTASNATSHLLYIERDGAAENVAREKEYPGYDPDVAEDGFTVLVREAEGRSAEEQQDFLERIPLKNLTDDEIDALELASFGTIGDTLEERRHFWKAVEQFEAEPQGDTIRIRFSADPEGWGLTIKNLDSAPTRLREKLRRMQGSSEPKDVELNLIRTDEAFAIHQWIVGLHPEALIEIEPGRGGRVQNRIIAELPFEIDGRERVEIVRNFTIKLTEKGLPFWAVVHAPDQNNDERNFHAHIVYYDRPSSRMKGPRNPDGRDVWDFEIEEEKVFPNRHRRTVYPFRRKKLREANRRTWIPMLRNRWATACNEVMERAGLIKRYDARSYEAMGIQLDPLEHIPSKTFNRERKGELTEDGVALACRQWQVMQDRLVADHEKRARHRQRVLKAKTDKARQVMGSQSPYKDIALKEVDRLTKLVDKVGARVTTNELFQDLGRLVADRVASRPKLIVHEDIKKNQKSPGRTKSKGGQGHGQTTQAPKDKNGATQPVGRAAKEAMTFLLEVYDRAVHMDRRNQIEIDVSKSQLNTLLKRLDNMMADPKRHPLDRRAPGFIDLNIADPGPEVIAARKKATMDRVADNLDAFVEAALPKILAEVKGASPAKPAPVQENIPQGSVSPQPSKAPVQPDRLNPAPAARDVSRAPVARPVADRAPIQRPSEVKPAPAKMATGEAAPKPAPARPLEPAARPQKTRFRPEPFYKPKEQGGAPAAAQPKNSAAAPVKSPAPAPVNSAPKSSAPNNSKPEIEIKTAATEKSGQAPERTSNNPAKSENAAQSNKPTGTHSGAAVVNSVPKAAALPTLGEAKTSAAAPSSVRPTATPTASTVRSAPAPATPTTPPAKLEAEPKKDAVTAKAPVAATPIPTKPAAQAPAPRPEPVRSSASPAEESGKTATDPKPAPAAPTAPKADKPPGPPKQSADVAPGQVRTPGEPPAPKPPVEKATIRVGDPLSPVTPKLIEPIRVEGKKLQKKAKKRGKMRDDGPGL
ncbi:MobA/MobL family protein [Microvirga sp. HBU67558]|uniref:MobA/MobL family protein n=1 Tax=Microvirga TaxID=186650 RepID=UPI001B37F3E2|nr:MULTISPECIES: MobA/MobL family protein [unclassified Microvirga]MBQ0819225.1 MobA/MobL family protein [Microvirga sp. HBU67558]